MNFLPRHTSRFVRNPILLLRFYKLHKSESLTLLKLIFYPILGAVTTFVIYCPIQPYILSICDLIFHDLPETDKFYLRSWLVFVLFIIVLINSFINIKNKKYPSILSVLIVLSICILYSFTVRIDKDFYKFRLFDFEKIYLFDLILISILTYITNFNLYPKKSRNKKGLLITDSADIKIENDNLYRKKQVKELVNIIENTTPSQAVSISIISDWGHGKSSFLKFISDELFTQNNIVQINFNPWLSKHSKPVIHLFFDQIYSELTKFDSTIADKIYKYSNDVLTSSEDYGMAEKSIKNFINLITPSHHNKSIQNQKTSINDRIVALEKKIVVIIDDLDRISGEDIMDIFSLIKNTIDFKNTFFLVSLDLQYTKNSLNSYNSFLEVNRYLEKIFQLQIILTPVIFEEISKLIKQQFRNSIGNNSDIVAHFTDPENAHITDEASRENANIQSLVKQFDLFIDGIAYYSVKFDSGSDINFIKQPGLLEKCIKNIRDLKRFLNSLIITLRLSDSELLLNDLFLLEILKLKFPEYYSDLSKGKYISPVIRDNDYYWAVNNQEINDIPKIDFLAGEIIKKIYDLEIIDEEGLITHPRSIKYWNNHRFYFNYDLFGDLSFKEFHNLGAENFISYQNFFTNNIIKKYANIKNSDLEDIYNRNRSIDLYFQLLFAMSYRNQRTSIIINSIILLSEIKGFYLPKSMIKFFDSFDFESNVIKEIDDLLFSNNSLELQFKNFLLVNLFAELKNIFNQKDLLHLAVVSIETFSINVPENQKLEYGDQAVLFSTMERILSYPSAKNRFSNLRSEPYSKEIANK